MKNIVIYVFISLMLILNSCGEDFIDLTPFSEANVDNFYRTQSDFENAVNATYDVLQDGRLYSGNFEYVLEVRSDNGVFNDPASESGAPFNIDKFAETTTNPYVEGPYKALFQGVQRANLVISRIGNAGFDNALKMQYEGEVRFIRALCYFHLVRLYGDVPLISKELTVSEIRNLTRYPTTDIYIQIEEDLKFASENLPFDYTTNDEGRVTALAASGILAKVYLTQNKLSLAKSELQKVISSGYYTLLPNIKDVFTSNNESNDEIIFAVRFRKGEGGEGHSLSFDYTTNPTVNPDLELLYDPLDARADLVKYVTSTGGRKVPLKYFDELSASNNTGLDIPVLRYADVLLMYAEVLNEEAYQPDNQGEAFTALNTVRTRAGLSPYTVDNLLNQVTFRAAVLSERRLELALEFSRWYDLLRTDSAISTFAALGISIDECDLLYPIPQSEIDVFNNENQFPQNCL